MSTEALLSTTVSVKIPRSAWAPGSRGTKQLETVATRVIAATGSFYLARGIGSQVSVGAAVDEERWVGKTHLPASLMLAQSEQFEASKSAGCKWGIPRAVYLIFCVILQGFVVLNFRNYCLVQIVSFWSLSIGVQTMFTTNELVDRIRNLKWNASPNDQEKDFLWKECAAGQIYYEIKCAAGNRCAAGQIFWLSPHGYSVLLMQ